MSTGAPRRREGDIGTERYSEKEKEKQRERERLRKSGRLKMADLAHSPIGKISCPTCLGQYSGIFMLKYHADKVKRHTQIPR
jgi:hypothetical protein